jgi:hypothetical protein
MGGVAELKYKNLSAELIANPTLENLYRLHSFFEKHIKVKINIAPEVANRLKEIPNSLVVGNHPFSNPSLWLESDDKPLYTGFSFWQWMLQKTIPNSKTVAKTTGYEESEKNAGYLHLPSSNGTKFIAKVLATNCLFLFPEGGARFMAQEIGGGFIHSARANNQTHVILMAMTDMPSPEHRIDLFGLLDIRKQIWETEEESVTRIKKELEHKIIVHKIKNKF